MMAAERDLSEGEALGRGHEVLTEASPHPRRRERLQETAEAPSHCADLGFAPAALGSRTVTVAAVGKLGAGTLKPQARPRPGRTRCGPPAVQGAKTEGVATHQMVLQGVGVSSPGRLAA